MEKKGEAKKLFLCFLLTIIISFSLIAIVSNAASSDTSQASDSFLSGVWNFIKEIFVGSDETTVDSDKITGAVVGAQCDKDKDCDAGEGCIDNVCKSAWSIEGNVCWVRNWYAILREKIGDDWVIIEGATAVTDEKGYYKIKNVEPGDYKIEVLEKEHEEEDILYVPTNPVLIRDVTIQQADVFFEAFTFETCDINLGHCIYGWAYEDFGEFEVYNENGNFDYIKNSEQGRRLEGREVSLLGEGLTTMPGQCGFYIFGEVDVSHDELVYNRHPHYLRTEPVDENSFDVYMEKDDDGKYQLYNYDFGDEECRTAPGGACIAGFKHIDRDFNKQRTWDELGLAGWTIDANGQGTPTQPKKLGAYMFPGLVTGYYEVIEILKKGWERTYATLYGVSAGVYTDINFGNVPACGGYGYGYGYGYGSCCVVGFKFDDKVYIEGLSGGLDARVDKGLEGWSIILKYLQGATTLETTTNQDGMYIFTWGGYGYGYGYGDECEPGDYEVYEIGKAGWTQTWPPLFGGSYNIKITQEDIDEGTARYFSSNSGPNDGEWLDFGNERPKHGKVEISGSVVHDDNPEDGNWQIEEDGIENWGVEVTAGGGDIFPLKTFKGPANKNGIYEKGKYEILVDTHDEDGQCINYVVSVEEKGGWYSTDNVLAHNLGCLTDDKDDVNFFFNNLDKNVDLADAPQSLVPIAKMLVAYLPASPLVWGFFPTIVKEVPPGLPDIPGPCHKKWRIDDNGEYINWTGVVLGIGVSRENLSYKSELDDDGIANIGLYEAIPTSDNDGDDNGTIFPMGLIDCVPSSFDFSVSIHREIEDIVQGDIITTNESVHNFSFNAWFDWNRDGDWNDSEEVAEGDTLYEHHYVDYPGPPEMVNGIFTSGPETGQTKWAAQTFTPSTAHTITKVRLRIGKIMSPDDDLIIAIKAVDIAGHPTGPDLANATIAPGDLMGMPDWHDISLDSGASLSADTMYAIVLRSDNDPMSGYYTYQIDYSDNYDGGHRELSIDGGITWTTQNDDIIFEEWGEETPQIPGCAAGDSPEWAVQNQILDLAYYLENCELLPNCISIIDPLDADMLITIINFTSNTFLPYEATQGRPIWMRTTLHENSSEEPEELLEGSIPISTCEDLQDINNDLSGDYYLASDIDCSHIVPESPCPPNCGPGFVPIGNDMSPFTGTFDGNGKCSYACRLIWCCR
jgi:hypothetical protein